jgi:uncharacterized damage-inducible protein DinB
MEMNRREAANAVFAGAAAMATVGVARAEGSIVDVLVAHWKKSKDLTLKVVEAMPAENYDYKPFADAGAFGRELIHIGQAEGFYLGNLGKGKPPTAPPPTAPKEAVAKFLGENFDWAIGVVGQLTDADLTKTITVHGSGMTGMDIVYNAMIHTAHTRGYVEMYLRNKGVVPPTYSV